MSHSRVATRRVLRRGNQVHHLLNVVLYPHITHQYVLHLNSLVIVIRLSSQMDECIVSRSLWSPHRRSLLILPHSVIDQSYLVKE